MPLVQGGPPEWVWERTADKLSIEVVASQSLEGHAVYQIVCRCGLEIIRLQFLTEEELRSFGSTLSGFEASRR